ncbi:MAG: AraC family transcriptional regulator [Proteobacteria bacterium]|nr:AraC family transcriptional regulator [Pseudomonadota bacterium]
MSQSAALTVRAAALTGFASLCQTHGIAAAPLLRRAGLDPLAEAEPDRRLPVAAVNLALELAAQAAGRDDFGLRLAELRGLANLGPVGLIARDEPTVGSALALIEAWLPLHNEALLVTRERSAGIVVLRAEILGSGPRGQARDIAVAMLHRILRQLAGTDWQPEEVCLTRATPAEPGLFRQALGPNIRFQADFDGLVVAGELLERPNPLADPAFRPYAARVLHGLDPRGDEAMAVRVSRLLALLLPSGRCTAEHVARHLGLSRRSLTRALAAEGTGFLALHDAARDEVAQRHLANRHRNLAQIADLLGFSSPSAFTTWFRRRHGVPPSSWRG